MLILERLHQYMMLRNLSFNKLEKSINASHGSISNAWKCNRNVGSQVIEKILNFYKEISAEWLLRGEGPMLLQTKVNTYQTSNEVDYSDILVRLCYTNGRVTSIKFCATCTKKRITNLSGLIKKMAEVSVTE